MPNWNPESPVSWARILGMVSVPMFGAARAHDHPGVHAVLLDGDRASFAFFAGEADPLLRKDSPAVEWPWSSNVRHTVIFDPQQSRLFTRRWDKPEDIKEHPRPDEDAARQLLEALAATGAPSRRTVIDRMTTVFRIIRSNIDELGGGPLDVLHAFNALLVGTGAVKRHSITTDEWTGAATLGEALALIEQKRLAAMSPGIVSKSVQKFAIQQLAHELIEREPETDYVLDPDLLIRHAAGVLYEEAHAELSRPRHLYRQQSLFQTVSLEAAPPTVAAKSDVHFTPPALARALVEEAVAALRSARAMPNRVEVLDPACGSGVFLIESLREVGLAPDQELSLRGVDISRVSCAMTDFALRRVVRDESDGSGKISVSVDSHDSLALDTWGEPDLILMNPPFTAWGAMSGEERAAVRDLLGDLYHGRPDKAAAFVWKAVRSLKPGAVLATLVPAPFLEGKATSALREAIEADPTLTLHLVGYFRGFGYFDATVEPAFLVLSRDVTARPSPPKVRVILADAGREDKAIREFRIRTGTPASSGAGWDVFETDRANFSPASWMPRSPRTTSLIEKLTRDGIPRVRDLFDVKLGIRTGDNHVFVLTGQRLRGLGAAEGELRLFRPAAGNSTIRAGTIRHGEYVFYPYGPDGEPLFKNDAELAGVAPQYYHRILEPSRYGLERRKSLRPPRKWWELVEPRATWQPKQQPKLVSSCFGGSGKFAYDATGAYAVLQGFGWLWRRKEFHETPAPWAYLALLNSPVFQILLGHYCPRVRGGQLDLYPKFVKKVFVPDLTNRQRTSGQVVASLAEMGRAIAQGQFPDPELLDRAVAEVYGLPLDVLRGETALPSVEAGAQTSASLESRFRVLVKQWKQDTEFDSSSVRMARHPAYQEIISMGQPVVPILLAELKRKPDFWFVALRTITGEDPVPPESAGRIKKMAKAWLEWGRSRGLVQ